MLIDIQTVAEKGRVFTLKEPLKISYNGKHFIVPINFKSDGVSVPRMFWRLLFPKADEKALAAGIAHDYIYRTHLNGWTKAAADKMFYAVMVENGVPKWKAYLAYKGVCWFGWLAWVTKGEI